ncbi:hypothetical protein EXN66_Car014163 [Channa argus]|uniref:Uncharacterized protein n=1 Tax=Channa argus TaxID=215402 RepID=A0A6G1Q7I7_CHAAH|nr:hypothetical protein EXN66_Car014163 [Channa argus]
MLSYRGDLSHHMTLLMDKDPPAETEKFEESSVTSVYRGNTQIRLRSNFQLLEVASLFLIRELNVLSSNSN